MTPEPVDVRDLFAPLWRRKWLIAAVVLLGTAGAYLYESSRPDRYRAATTIFIQQSGPGALIGGPESPVDSDRSIQNQAQFLSSRDLAEAVKDRIAYRGDAHTLLEGLTVIPQKGSDFVGLEAEWRSPDGAARIANAFALEFISSRSREYREQVDDALKQARQELETLTVAGAATIDQRRDLRATIRRLEIARGLPAVGVRQLDPANPPAERSAPHPLRAAVFGFGLALIIALGLAFALERIDRRLKLRDIEHAFDAPLLATFPETKVPTPAVNGAIAFAPALREPSRMLRTAIAIAGVDTPLRKVLITSALPSEGKSTTVRNLALAFAESGRSVAVVDADLRKSELSQTLAHGAEYGLVDVLVGQVDVEQALIPVGAGPPAVESAEDAADGGPVAVAELSPTRLDLLAGGDTPADPPSVLGSARMRDLLDEVADMHDVVLIDSAPLLPVSDTLPLLSAVDAVIVVARIGETTRDAANRCATAIGRVPSARLLGVVANGVSDDDAGIAGYGYGYGYGYGS